LIIVNDASTDNTEAVIDGICKLINNLKIRVIKTENQGVSKARNIALDNAEGKYMASVYIPIRISEKLDTEPVTYNYHPFVIEQNKSYNFRINMVTCRKDNGDNAIQGVVVQD
jgi:glycosyltransferase involved in cell wall biosynthesis